MRVIEICRKSGRDFGGRDFGGRDFELKPAFLESLELLTGKTLGSLFDGGR